MLAAGVLGAPRVRSAPAVPSRDLPVDAPKFVHLANATSYDGTGFYAQDALFDDNGADSGGDIYSLLTGFEGDAHAVGEQTGVGDIRSVRVDPVPGQRDAAVIRVTMNSLHVTTEGNAHPGYAGVERLHPVAFVGIDDRDGGFSGWPHGAGLATPGLDRGYTLTFDEFATATDGGAPSPVDVEIDGHTLSVTVRGLASRQPRLVVGAGVWDPLTARWKAPSASLDPVLDLALSCPVELRPDITTPARDDAACEWRQSADLAAAETSSSFFTVDLDRLGEVAPAPPPERGYASYVYLSAIDNGDGYYRYTGNPQFLGPWQAFTVALPAQWQDRPNPMVVYLHGGAAWGTLQAAVDKFTNKIADAGQIVVYPYGRGPAGWWFPVAEADVFEAISAVESTFPVGTDRRVLSGISMGGYGTSLLGWSHPDLWAGLVTYMGANDSQYARAQARPDLPVFDTSVLAGNGTNVPMLLLAGTEQTEHENALRRQLLTDLEVEHTFKQFAEPLHGAKFTPDAASHVVAWLEGLPSRVSHPRTIRYTTDPSWFAEPAGDPYRATGNIVRRGNAWWLREVMTDSGGLGTVEATDERVGRDASRAATPWGPTPASAAAVPVLLWSSGVNVDHAGVPSGEGVSIELDGIDSFIVDLERLGLPVGGRITVTSDGPALVRSSGGRLCLLGTACGVATGPTVAPAGAACSVDDVAGVPVAAGTSTLVVTSSACATTAAAGGEGNGGPGRGRDEGGRTLPATGGRDPILALPLLFVAVLAWRLGQVASTPGRYKNGWAYRGSRHTTHAEGR